MSAWTEQDLEALRSAIASGAKRVSYSGPPAREKEYQSLREMRELLSSIEREINGAPRFRRVKWKRGFRDGC